MIEPVTDLEARVVFQTSHANRKTVRAIAEQVAMDLGLSLDEILGPTRRQPITRARQLIMYRAHQAGHSLSHIGRCLNRDHTSVLWGIRRIEDLLAEEKQ